MNTGPSPTPSRTTFRNLPACSIYRLNRPLRESFTSRNLPIPPLPAYIKLPRIAVQRDAPMPLLSCGTFAMSTTLRLLLGGIPPHTLPTQFITRGRMLTLHRALLKWLIHDKSPDLWHGGCLHQGIHPPHGTNTCPLGCISIAAAHLLPRGRDSTYFRLRHSFAQEAYPTLAGKGTPPTRSAMIP